MSESKFNLPTLIAAILISVVLSVAISYSVISRETGPPGPEGSQGEQGIQGIQGEVGQTGSQGTQGEPGEPGKPIIVIYERFVRTNYGVIINGGLEERIEDRPHMPVGWDGGGTIGGADGYSGRCVALHSWHEDHGSDLYQEISVNNTSHAFLLFWVRPVPRDDLVTLQVFFDYNIVYSQTFTELSDWTLITKEFFVSEGTHLLKFHVTPYKTYERGETPFIAIDEVSLLATH